ncbi:MAG: DNA-formamidopyrimidine glycosylase family protein, partial [Actinomycetota bacterium]
IRNPLSDDKAFAVTLNRHRIEAIERWGKTLVFRLDGDMAVIFHFKLGANVSCHKQHVPETDGVAWNFSDGTALEFCDLALSEFHLAHNSELDHLPVLKHGADPLARSFNHELLKDILSPRKQVKTALTDQDVISGIGNTYADEILWHTRINPFRKVAELKENDFRELTRQIKSTLRESIRRGGEESFKNARGRRGRYQTKVHGREGEPCLRDGAKIKAAKRGRRTFWCPKCQK